MSRGGEGAVVVGRKHAEEQSSRAAEDNKEAQERRGRREPDRARRGPTADTHRPIPITSAENHHTQSASLTATTITPDERTVDHHGSTLPPGNQQSYDLIDCRSGALEATHLRVQLDLGPDGHHDGEHLLELEEGDCQPGGGPPMTLTVTRNGQLVVAKDA